MSEFDEMDLDPSEVGDAFGEEDMQPEELLKLVTLDRVRRKKVRVELKNEDGEEIALKDVIKELYRYTRDKMKDSESNQFKEQIMPLMAQSVTTGLASMVGVGNAAFLLSQNLTRGSIITMMCVAFLFLKFIQQNKLQIFTYEEDVTDEEIEAIDRKSHANSVATVASLAGQNPIEVLKELKANGKLTDQDLKELIGEEKDENDGNNGGNGSDPGVLNS